MLTLALEEGDLLQILSADLPQGSFVQLQPQSPDFLDISDPKAVLENTLRNFSTLTMGDKFQFKYNDLVYEIAVLLVKPESGSMSISVVETDLSVDFATPLGYIEPQRQLTPNGGRAHTPGGLAHKLGYEALKSAAQKPSKFASKGHKMSGKQVADNLTEDIHADDSNDTPTPLQIPLGTLFFGYELRLPKNPEEATGASKLTKTFSGTGQSIRQSKKLSKLPGDSKMRDVIEID